MQQITENSLNVCANGITSEEISEIRNCIRRIARRRELEGKKMFVARESGPELVGRMGNRSAVANNNQIIAGIRAGVFEAVVNAFER